jgi:hypothetical protein
VQDTIHSAGAEKAAEQALNKAKGTQHPATAMKAAVSGPRTPSKRLLRQVTGCERRLQARCVVNVIVNVGVVNYGRPKYSSVLISSDFFSLPFTSSTAQLV